MSIFPHLANNFVKHCILTIFCSVILMSCAVGPNFRSPAPPQTLSYTECPLAKKTVSTRGKGGNAQEFMLGQDIPGQWWELFHSPALNQLIRDGIQHNPNMSMAQAALRQAKENLKAEFGNLLLPAIDGNGYAERQRLNSNTFGTLDPSQVTSSTFNLYNASVSVSYTLDVFGGSRRQVEAMAALVDYQHYQLVGTYLTLTSNIVTTAINVASLSKQIEATQELICNDEKLLHVIQQQFSLGGVSRADVLTQETQLAQTRANLPPLLNNLARAKHALSVLEGALPSEAAVPNIDLDSLVLPRHLPIGIPSLLVRQRPDVQAVEATLHQASAQIGVATANLLPQFTLTGNYGVTGNFLSSLFNPNNIYWNIMAQITQPLFHGGALIAKRKAAVANYKQVGAQYRLTVLQAFQNVADCLRAIEIDAKNLQIQTQAERSAFNSLKLIQQQYRLGATNYINLLIAVRQYQQTHIARIQAQATRYADTAALFQALGGGWWNTHPSLGLVGKK